MSRLAIRLETLGRAVVRRLAGARAPSDPRRILVAHYLLLGDTVLLAPLLKALRDAHPDARIVVLARVAFAPLFDAAPWGVECLPFDRRDAGSTRRVLASGPYDLAIVPDDNRYAWLAKAAGAARVVAFAHDRPAWKNWPVDDAVAYPDRPAAWADLAAACLGPGRAVAPFARGEWPAPQATAFDRPATPFAVLHVGASTPLKRWPPDRWRALADALRTRGLAIVWSGGRGEGALLEAIGRRPDEHDAIGRLDLPQLWALLAAARLVVGPDTGVTHLARVVGVPTVALFGPGSSVIHGAGRFWHDAPFRAVTVEDFPCRDQRTLYRREVAWVRRCGRRYDRDAAPGGRGDPDACSRPLCMHAITLETVEAAAATLLAPAEAADLPAQRAP